MKKTILLTGLALLVALLPVKAQNNYPVTGISDDRPQMYGLKNATVVVDYNHTLKNTDILIVKGRIQDVGQSLDFPEGTVITDLTGKTVYPSFIDLYSNYGMPEQTRQQTNPMAAFMSGSRQQAPSQAKPRIADYWNEGIRESYDAVSEFKTDKTKADELRKSGFGAVLTSTNNGIARGTAAFVQLIDEDTQEAVLKSKATTGYSFSKGRSQDMYPTAQYGSIALLRQFNYDGDWYNSLPDGYFYDASLEALKLNKTLPKIFEVRNHFEVIRASNVAKEFGFSYIVKGGGDEYQELDDIKASGVSLILPVNFPAVPDVKDPFDAAAVPLSQLKHWEMAPANASMVNNAGISFSITASGLTKSSEFLPNLRKAVQYGLPKSAALKAVTFTPASMAGVNNLVGSVKKGMLANLLVTSGDIFEKDCIIYENWVGGRQYIINDPSTPDIRGAYTLAVGDSNYNLSISGTVAKPASRVQSGEKVITSSLVIDKGMVLLSLKTDRGTISLSGQATGKKLNGEGVIEDGSWVKWSAELSGDAGNGLARQFGRKQTGEPDLAIGKVIYPFEAYGWETKPQQEDVLFKNATVWTLEEEGKIENCDVLVKDGKIAKVGQNLKAGKARVIDATGMHLTPGIIDEHSHIAMSATNEMGQAITSEVRVADIIDPADMSIYRQLSGGVTAAHILHGSANPIGGQSVIIKHRWGSSAEDMKVKGQVGFLKHALGENVKRTTSRYPNTRMGTEHIIRDAYQRAVDYRNDWNRYNNLSEAEKAKVIRPRKDLELDALVDVLEKRSFIACHTYVQSEGNMIMKLAEDFGVKAHTLIHFNEGYKIADKIAQHGTAASVFSDWWNYKYEVYEGIPYNAATLLQNGVLTCLHSDNAELARRLNQEAGKIVKYGGVDEVEALKLVTLNTAKILHLDDRMGSIKEGKDADLALWTGHPLSMYSRASKTMVDGIIYFDEEKDAAMKKSIDEERNRIIQKILKQSSSSAAARTPGMRRRTN